MMAEPPAHCALNCKLLIITFSLRKQRKYSKMPKVPEKSMSYYIPLRYYWVG